MPGHLLGVFERSMICLVGSRRGQVLSTEHEISIYGNEIPLSLTHHQHRIRRKANHPFRGASFAP